MTKVLLDTVFCKCIADAIGAPDGKGATNVTSRGAASGLGIAPAGSVDGSTGSDCITSVRDSLVAFERTYREAYTDVSGIARLTELAGTALRTGRSHLYYVGVGLAGMVGMIDASEMVDTCAMPLSLTCCSASVPKQISHLRC